MRSAILLSAFCIADAIREGWQTGNAGFLAIAFAVCLVFDAWEFIVNIFRDKP